MFCTSTIPAASVSELTFFLLTQHGSCHCSIKETDTIFNFLSHVGLDFKIPIIYSLC
jgi:hypothetical protein